MYDYRYQRDDFIPLLKDMGVTEILKEWLNKNATEDFLNELVQIKLGLILAPTQLRQLISDLQYEGSLSGVDIANLPAPVMRAAAPPGLGCSNGNVWITPFEGAYSIRFYVNGIYKTTLIDYNVTDLATLGAAVGDVIQVSHVVDGIPGWWASITVS